jgi:hypothetical protein
MSKCHANAVRFAGSEVRVNHDVSLSGLRFTSFLVLIGDEPGLRVGCRQEIENDSPIHFGVANMRTSGDNFGEF